MKPEKPRPALASKDALHPRNLHRERYDFAALSAVCPALKRVLRVNPQREVSIDFANPIAVKLLNRALLALHYRIRFWDIPDGFLCPPIPGRADYLHYLADLLASTQGNPYGKVAPPGEKIAVLDVGTGANGIYPLLGNRIYGWRFVGSETDPQALRNAQAIVRANPPLQQQIECRLQASRLAVFAGVIRSDERFDLTLCNPPFHASKADAALGTARKLENLAANVAKKSGRGKRQRSAPQTGSAVPLNFGGQEAELWCPGGELGFIKTMIGESRQFAGQCLWFSTLVSKKDNLRAIHEALKACNAMDVKTIEMQQGQKQSRFVAWTFLSPLEQRRWCELRWR